MFLKHNLGFSQPANNLYGFSSLFCDCWRYLVKEFQWKTIIFFCIPDRNISGREFSFKKSYFCSCISKCSFITGKKTPTQPNSLCLTIVLWLSHKTQKIVPWSGPFQDFSSREIKQVSAWVIYHAFSSSGQLLLECCQV